MKEYSYGVIPYKFDENGVSILLSKTSKRSEHGFVKGKIDFGETPKECTVREVFEEIGIRIDIVDLEEFVFQKNPKKDIGLYFINWEKYLDMEFKLAPKEIYSVEWFNIKKLTIVSKNQRKILTDIAVKFDKLNFIKSIKDFHAKNEILV